jgi:hypothetical protein
MAAMDRVLVEHFGKGVTVKDEDLPGLLPAMDTTIERVLERAFKGLPAALEDGEDVPSTLKRIGYATDEILEAARRILATRRVPA